MLLTAAACLLSAMSNAAEKSAPVFSEVPETKILAPQFETASKPWRIPVTDSTASRTLTAPVGSAWDFRNVSALSVKAERANQSGTSARLRWLVNSRAGGMYVGASVPLPISGVAAPSLNFLESAGELAPVGHQRPWDALAAAEITSIELRVECSARAVNPEPLEIALSAARIVPSTLAAVTPRLTDIALESPPPGSRAKAVLIFRIDPMPADPYAPNGEGDVRIKFSSGGRALAFLDQDLIPRDDGSATRWVAAGLPYWRAYLPEWDEKKGVMEIVSGTHSWKLHCEALKTRKDIELAEMKIEMAEMKEEIKRAQSQPPETPTTPAPSQGRRPPGTPPSVWYTGTKPRVLARARWETPLESPPPNATQEVSWTGTSSIWRLSENPAWELFDGQLEKVSSIWRPVPFWNSAWGGYSNARRPDPAMAKALDNLLEEAAQKGDSRPLAILDGGALERQGVFNWASHPLRAKISGPGEMFTKPEGIDFCARWMRYCIARYAHSKAVSALWMTSDLNAPDAGDFHAKIAPMLNDWRARPDFATPILSFHPLANTPGITKLVASFERSKTGEASKWKADQRLGSAMGRELDKEGWHGSRCFELRALDAATTTIAATRNYQLELSDYRKPSDDNFHTSDALMFDVWTPPDSPHDLRIGVHVRDRDGEWFQALLPGTVRQGDWTSYALDLSAKNVHKLTPVNPGKVWTDYSRQRITEIGLHIYSTHPNWKVSGLTKQLDARFDNIRGVAIETKAQEQKLVITLFDPLKPDAIPSAKKTVERGELVEYHVQINKAFANPFDPRDCDLVATVTSPSGKTARVPLFFNQLCERHEQTPGGNEIVDTRGVEFFTMRYRAQEAGAHALKIELREHGRYDNDRTWEDDERFTPLGESQASFSRNWPHTQYPRQFPDGKRPIDRIKFIPGIVSAELDLGPTAFEVKESAKPFHGFVRTASDKRHFEFDDGTFFYPIGPCLRSPSDTRIPYASEKFNRIYIDKLGKRGTYQYDDYFDSFSKAGINWARVWMCSWWGALEWRRDWPGYQGLGRYNLLNAWRMDYIVDLAEKKGLYLNVAITNHGQFSLNIDTEWKNNPYNAALGGPIAGPMEIFTRDDAKILHQNKLRYVAARYGHSPNVMAFALFSELEFTEEYERSLEPAFRGGFDAPAPHMEAWHSEMASFLKSIDPNRHMVATHFSHPVRGEGTLAVPEVDIATSNAYSAFEELGGIIRRGEQHCDAGEALSYFWNGNPNFNFKGFKIFNKPALVEEQGRHWMGMDGGRETNTKAQLDADLHAGLWGSMVTPLSGATGYWWWLHVHFDNRYGDYTALAKYMEKEDFRPMKDEKTLEPVTWKVTDELYGRAMKSDRRVYAWIYNPLTPMGDVPVPDVANAILKGGGLKPGKYTVEFWDTYAGEKIETRQVEVVPGSNTPFALKMPIVKKDLAVKIKPALP